MMGVSILACLFAVGMTTIPRGWYYFQLAEYQGKLERLHQNEARKLRSEYRADPKALGAEVLPDSAQDEDERAAHHSLLKQRYLRAALYFWESIPPDLPLRYPWDQDRDRQVLEAALLDLLDPKNPYNQTSDDGTLLHQIIIDKSTTRRPVDDIDVERLLSEHGFPTDAAADLARRNSLGSVSIAGFRFERSEILINDLESMGLGALTLYPNAKGFLRASLPGYSPDGKIAVVALCDFLAYHPNAWVYGLVLSNGRWDIQWRYRYMSE
jgi:hypothetical protein